MGKRRHAYRTHRELIEFYVARARALNMKGAMWRCPYCDEIPESVRAHLRDDHHLSVAATMTWGLAVQAAASLQGAKSMTVEVRLSTITSPGFCTKELRAERWTHAYARPEDALAIWICEHLHRLGDLGFPVRFVPDPHAGMAYSRTCRDGQILLSRELFQILMALDPHGPRWYPDWFKVLDAWLAETEREQAGRAA